MKSILITGGAGFIGSNFLTYMLEKHKNYRFINLDKLTYAGSLDNLVACEKSQRYKFIQGDICNRELLTYIFLEFDITGVIHFAAESHVDNSIKIPDIFIKTNVHGTFSLLDVAKEQWMEKPFSPKKGQEDCRFLHVSTDEVFGSLGDTSYFTEDTPYAPNSPYSASKASSDMLVRAYHKTYGLNTVITNCSNNYGARQHGEKLIPTIIRNALSGSSIPIYGNGKNVRDWLYVLDHCRGISKAFHEGGDGETYNFGGDAERTNIEVAQTICNILDTRHQPKESYKDLITYVDDRAGHDFRYAIDCTKAKQQLNWRPQVSFEEGIETTIDWYLEKYRA